jgi:hypothetical protein
MNTIRNLLLATLFVPALATAADAVTTGDTNKVTGQVGGTNKVTGQPMTNGSTNTNDKNSTTTGDTGQRSGKSSAAGDAFARLDTNRDGKLSAAEAAADPKVHGMWKKFKTSNDGTVSQAEFDAHEAELK